MIFWKSLLDATPRIGELHCYVNVDQGRERGDQGRERARDQGRENIEYQGGERVALVMWVYVDKVGDWHRPTCLVDTLFFIRSVKLLSLLRKSIPTAVPSDNSWSIAKLIDIYDYWCYGTGLEVCRDLLEKHDLRLKHAIGPRGSAKLSGQIPLVEKEGLLTVSNVDFSMNTRTTTPSSCWGLYVKPYFIHITPTFWLKLM